MKKQVTTQLARVRQHGMLQDGWFLLLIGLNLVSLLALMLWSGTHIHPTELSVPIRYTSFANFDMLGKWFQLYDILGIASLVFIINLLLAFVAHSTQRLLSAFLLITSLICSVVGLAILLGFTAINVGGV